MALTKTYLGDNPDGTPHFNVTSDSKNPHFLLTGPDSVGVLHTDDGTAYDVTPSVIEVGSEKHAQQLAGAIDKHLRTRGLHPEQKAAL